MSDQNSSSSGASDAPENNQPAAPSLSKRKQLLFFFILGLLLLLFAEVSLQLFYRATVGRWLWQWWAVPIYQADPVRTYRLKSNLDFLHQTREFTARYRTDEQGLRMAGGEPPLTVAKSNDVFRVLMFGPSFAFGWGVEYEDSYAWQIAHQLRVPGRRVELINLGTPSQRPSFQLRWLRETGYCYQPDLILQTVFGSPAGMEVDDSPSSIQPQVHDGYLHVTRMTWTKRVRLWSATLFYGWHLYHNTVGRRIVKTGPGRELYRPEASGTDDELVRRFRRYEEFVRSVTTNHPRVVFLHVPEAQVIRPSDRGRASYAMDAPATRRQTAHITSLLRSNQVHFLDPTDALVAADQKERMYFLYDIHFTPAGNKVVTDFAVPLLQPIVTPAK